MEIPGRVGVLLDQLLSCGYRAYRLLPLSDVVTIQLANPGCVGVLAFFPIAEKNVRFLG